MKKTVIFFTVLILCGAAVFLYNPEPTPSQTKVKSTPKQTKPVHYHKFVQEISRIEPTCTEDGEQTLKCEGCEETKIIVLSKPPHQFGEAKITKRPTIDSMGEKQSVCTVCGYVKKEYVASLGYSWESPVDVELKTFYNDVCSGKFSKYEGKYVRLKGTVKSISNYGDIVGYYLYGKKGEGVVGWVNGKAANVKVGNSVVMVGEVKNQGINHVELINCRFE